MVPFESLSNEYRIVNRDKIHFAPDISTAQCLRTDYDGKCCFNKNIISVLK